MTSPLGRRAAMLLAGFGTAGVARHALAQADRIRAWPVPCATGPGEIAAILLEGRGGAGGTVTTFGMPFAPGEVPRGAGLAARLHGGGALPVQVDVVTRHGDGSARFGVVALAAPALPPGEHAGVLLRRASAAQPAFAAEAALGQRRAALRLGAAGGRAWQIDLVAAARRALAEGMGPWQSGPLAVQYRIAQAVPALAVGGATSMRCVADLAIHADGSLNIEVWLRNDVAMRTGGGNAAYDVELEMDGRTVLAATSVRQTHYTAWGRRLATMADGSPAPEAPLVRHDAVRLAAVGAVAPYDLAMGIAEPALRQFASAMAQPAWHTPLGPRDIAQDMFAPAGRQDIGPVTGPQAIWLMTGDARAATYSIGQAEAAGSVPWHFWDPDAHDGATRGGWLDTRRWSRLWADPRGRRPPAGLLQPISGDSGWAADTAHQPDLAYLPYLLTGRRAFLDEVQAQAAWSVMSRAPNQWERGLPGARGPGEGVNVARGHQVRGAAWCLRQLGNANWATPAEDAQQAWFDAAEQGNWAWIRSKIPEWSRAQGEAHGWIPGVYGVPGALPPWQQDMFASAAAAAARRGQADARAVLAWMENFLAGRFLAASRGFNPRDGAAYLIAIAPERSDPPPFTTWAKIAEETVRRDWSNREGWPKSQGNYAQYALQSLAALDDVLGSEKARRARAWLLAAGAPFTGPGEFDPPLSIVPRRQQTSGLGDQACGSATPTDTSRRAARPVGGRSN